MNNEDRDNKISKIYDICIKMEPMVVEHHRTLYDDDTGISKRVILLEERQDNCPARKANTTESKRVVIATVMMAIAIISTISMIIVALVK